MDINRLYENNPDFKHYVKAYAKDNKKTVEEVLHHKMVTGAAEYYVEKTRDVISENPATLLGRS